MLRASQLVGEVLPLVAVTNTVTNVFLCADLSTNLKPVALAIGEQELGITCRAVPTFVVHEYHW